MNKQELLQRLQDIEWDNFEVKKAENKLPQSCWDTVSAFANTSGGWLVLGVSQLGKKFERRFRYGKIGTGYCTAMIDNKIGKDKTITVTVVFGVKIDRFVTQDFYRIAA